MLNWRRDPAREMQIERSEQGTKQLEKELALLYWIHSEIDLIEADLQTECTTAGYSSDCLTC
jgi:hypothetical protein